MSERRADHVTTSDGVRIAVTLEGRPGAPVVVFGASLGATHAMWDAQVAALADRYRVLRFDTRGHGASDAPRGPYTIERLGRDVVELLDAYDIEKVRYCGLSLGGIVGQWLGAHAGDRLDGLVLACTAPYMGPRAGWDERIALVETKGLAALVDATMERWFTPAFRARAPREMERIVSDFVATSPVGYAGCLAAIRDMDLREDAKRIDVPSVLVAGMHDPGNPPERLRELSRAMPRHPEVVVLDAAHLASVEQPEAFTRAVSGPLR